MRWTSKWLVLAAAVLACAATNVPAQDEIESLTSNMKSIFNGKNLDGWDGDSRFWSVKDGVIHGETTKETPAPHNTFLIYRGEKLGNFVLQLKFRILGGNSGVQYRCEELDDYAVRGYQAEVANGDLRAGYLYDEKGRGHLARVGDFTVVDKDGKVNKVGHCSDPDKLMEAPYYKKSDWNDYTIIARGNHLMHYVNGHQTVEVIDNDPKGFDAEGLLALQIHAGPPMVVEFKDLRLKNLDANYGKAIRLFNGSNLNNWTVSSDKVKGVFGVRPDITWNNDSGVITDTGSPAGYLRTKENYTNYVLRVRLRHLSEGNSGVLMRIQEPDKVWPRGIEAQGLLGNLGVIWNIDKFPMKTDPDRTKGRRTEKLNKTNEKPLGGWDEYEIELNQSSLRIYVNRLLQNWAEEVAEMPGHIALQSEGAKMEFKNIVLIPIMTGEQTEK